MKITEILVESKQLNEGPLLNKIGDVVGKGVGGVGKGIGAVAGGVAGLGTAIKKGYQAGKATVAGGGDDEEQPSGTTPAADASTAPAAQTTKTPATTTAPVKPKGDSATMQGVKSGINKALGAKAFDVDPKVPAAQQAAQDQQATGQAPQARTAQASAQKTTQAPAAVAQQSAQAPAKTAQSGQTMYAQVKANIDQLDKKGKQRIYQLLQKSLGAPAGAGAPAGSATSTRDTSKDKYDQTTGELTAYGQAQKTAADAAEAERMKDPEYAARDARIKARLQAAQDAWDQEDKAASAAPAEVPAKKTRAASRVPKKAAPTQDEIDADRAKIMGPTSDSIIRTAKPISESFSLYRKQ